MSPIWGKLADQKGRRIMLLRAALGMAIAMILMGLVSNVYQFVGLRLLMGIFQDIFQQQMPLLLHKFLVIVAAGLSGHYLRRRFRVC